MNQIALRTGVVGGRPLQQLMTRDEFIAWLGQSKTRVYVSPHKVVPCACGDLNCHGWRLVPTWGAKQRRKES